LISRLTAALIVLVVAPACGGTPAPSPIRIPTPVKLPPPSLHPNYPPVDLADLVALAQQGTARRFLVAEGQNLGPCSRGWDRIFEPDGTSSQQKAADLLMFAMTKNLLTKSCGGMVFGTTNDAFCNCYHGDHGYLEIDRGPAQEPSVGKMEVIFETAENQTAPGDWDITVGAPSG
jgi:hypothetical protein